MCQTSTNLLPYIPVPKFIKIPILIGNLTAGLYILGHIAIYIFRKQVINLYSGDLEDAAMHTGLPLNSIISCSVIGGFTLYVLLLIVKDKNLEISQRHMGSALSILISVYLVMSILNYPISFLQSVMVGQLNGCERLAALGSMSAASGMLEPLKLITQMLYIGGVGMWYGFIRGQQNGDATCHVGDTIHTTRYKEED